MTDAASQQEKQHKPERVKQDLSRPVFKRSVTLNCLQAQRVMGRSFQAVSNSLFSIDVILRIIGDQEEIDQIEGIIQDHMARVSEDLKSASDQMVKLMEDNGIEGQPEYTSPSVHEIEINAPQTATFIHLVKKLDDLMLLVDTLWLNSVLTSKQRKDANYQWQQRLIKLAGRIIGIEKRARISAHTKGKQDEVDKEVPATVTEDSELAQEANETVAEVETEAA